MRDLAQGTFPTPDRFHEGISCTLSPPPGWAERKLKAGNGLILLDGLDELAPTRRHEALSWIHGLVHNFKSGNIFVASSRPAALEEGELSEVGFVEYGIRDLSSSACREFVQRWHEAVALHFNNRPEQLRDLDEKRARLLSELESNPFVARLATSPLLCALLCALNRVYRQSLPETLYDLCESACKMLLWDRDKFIELPEQVYPSGYHQLNYVMRLKVVRELAYAIVKEEGTFLAQKSVLDEIRIALNQPENSDLGEPKEVLRGLLERSGLIRMCREDDIEFVHNALRDYLASLKFARRNEYQFLVQKMDKGGWERWEPVLQFAAATADYEDFVVNLLRAILTFDGLSSAQQRRRELTAIRVAGRVRYRLDASIERQVRAIREQMLPVNSVTRARDLAEAGEVAAEYLEWQHDRQEDVSAACVRGLIRIGGEQARKRLNTYFQEDHRPAVLEELAQFFSPAEMASLTNVLLIPSVLTGVQTPNGVPRSFLPYVKDLTPLANMKDLRRLFLQNTQVSDLAALLNLDSLQELHIENTQVCDLKPVIGLRNLRRLFLQNTPIDDLGPLAHLEALQELWIQNTRVRDLSPLVHLKELRELWLKNTPAYRAEAEHLQKRRQEQNMRRLLIDL